MIASDFIFAVASCKNVMNSKIQFRTASDSEHDEVLQFLRENFFTEEAINNAYPLKDERLEEEFILSLLPLGNIIFAIDSTSNQIAGLASFGAITKHYAQESWDESETTTNQKWRDILKFMSHIEKKASVCERFGVTEALHMHGVTVDKRYRGRAIGKMLFNECFKVAKSRNYQLVSADCTSVHSIHIADAVGMSCISEVTYDEYHEKIGKTIFYPTPPNTVIKTYVMIIE